jgi:hypothetical protein
MTTRARKLIESKLQETGPTEPQGLVGPGTHEFSQIVMALTRTGDAIHTLELIFKDIKDDLRDHEDRLITHTAERIEQHRKILDGDLQGLVKMLKFAAEKAKRGF